MALANGRTRYDPGKRMYVCSEAAWKQPFMIHKVGPKQSEAMFVVEEG